VGGLGDEGPDQIRYCVDEEGEHGVGVPPMPCRHAAVASLVAGTNRTPDRSWAQYRFGTGCTVLCVQIVHRPGHRGNDGRSETHRHLDPLGWGPKGRWFKSSRPD
jgi:hypothetical protein